MRNKENIQKWLQDLRSGNYQKTNLRSRTQENCFCALGVACERYRLDTQDGHWVNDIFVTEHSASYQQLPRTVALWYGFTLPDSLTNRSPEAMFVMSLNDDFEFTFEEIADQFETRYPF